MRRLSRAQLRRKRRLPPKPEPPEHGIYIMVGEGEEQFFTWAELEAACKDMFDPRYATDVEQQLGKIDFRRDPTYNLNRRTKP